MESRLPQIVTSPSPARPAKLRGRNQIYIVAGVLAVFALGVVGGA
jgi:hypothetical protein